MDRLTALVSIAHLRLRLDVIQKYPHLINEITDMEIKRPIELAGLRSRLARAKKTEADIAVTGKRFDAALDEIDSLHDVAVNHAVALEQYSAELKSMVDDMTSGSNGAPNDQPGPGGQIISSATGV